jgi:hypothetical protein
MDFLGFFKSIGSIIVRAFHSAAARGLTDAIVSQALDLVKTAAQGVLDNAGKREWVVAALVAKGIPESIARLAVELAVQEFKGVAAGK